MSHIAALLFQVGRVRDSKVDVMLEWLELGAHLFSLVSHSTHYFWYLLERCGCFSLDRWMRRLRPNVSVRCKPEKVSEALREFKRVFRFGVVE